MISNKVITWVIACGFFALVLSALFLITSPFIEGFAWALILVLITWPILNSLKKVFHGSDHLAALTLSLSLTAISLLILVPAALELGKELYHLSNNRNLTTERLLISLINIPLIGDFFESEQFNGIIKSLSESFLETSIRLAGQASQVVFSSIFNIGVMLFFSYFLYRYGKKLMKNVELVVTFYGGPQWLHFFELTEKTIKGVVYGALMTALAQGLLAGIGFYLSGAPFSLILAFSTVLFSFVPFGAPMIYVPVAFYLAFISGNLFAGLGLLLYGVAVISTSDNIIRPLFISHTIQISLLLVFVGVLGGILAFGLIGLFIGPVIIAIINMLWNELVSRSVEAIQGALQSNSLQTPLK